MTTHPHNQIVMKIYLAERITELYKILKSHEVNDIDIIICQKTPSHKEFVNTTHFFPAEKQTGSIEQGSENAEYGGGSSSALAPFCCEETLRF